MSRTKENDPLNPSRRIGRTPKTILSDDFFTDSLISHDSRIPSPSPQKTNGGPPRAARPRRAVGTSRAPNGARAPGAATAHRNSRSESETTSRNKPLQPAPPPSSRASKAPRPSPLQINAPSTPPRSRYPAPSLTTPTSEFSSPPAGMTDVYQRIADEEDLAATARTLESDEEEDLESVDPRDPGTATSEGIYAYGQDKTGDQDKAAEAVKPVVDPLAPAPPPLQAPADSDKENFLKPAFDDSSEAGTLDFLQNDLTDRVLAAKLTPHVVDRAKDRARLNRLMQGALPIDFGTTPKSKEGGSGRETPLSRDRRPVPLPDAVSNLVNRGPINFGGISGSGAVESPRTFSESSADLPPSKRVAAFRKSAWKSKPAVASENDETVDGPAGQKPPGRAPAFRKAGKKPTTTNEAEPADDSDTPDELKSRERVVAFSKADRTRRAQSEEPIDPARPQIPRLQAFSKASKTGRSIGHQGSSEPPYTASNRVSAPESVTSEEAGSDPTQNATDMSAKIDHASTRDFLRKWKEEALAKRAARLQPDMQPDKELQTSDDHTEQVDWLGAGADVPLPSVEREGSSTPKGTPPKSNFVASLKTQRSQDRMRKWDNDFTGLSFQVSDSPPVRPRSKLNDVQEREIEILAKRAVATNRLGEISEKDPQQVIRKSSRSSLASDSNKSEPNIAHDKTTQRRSSTEAAGDGEQIPDTPVVIYRSSSGSLEKSKTSQRPSPASSNSYEQLQRLARAVSTTPKASPVQQSQAPEPLNQTGDDENTTEEDPRPDTLSADPAISSGKVAATPKVTGAWTDTILPDTVLPLKTQPQTQSYLQTPHVNAGAWIDTPMVNGNFRPSLPNTIEEVTEELTDDFLNVGKEESAPTRLAEVKTDVLPAPPPNDESGPASNEVLLPPSALQNVLNEAKAKRLVSQDGPDHDPEDTLNLGDATIQSIEGLLTLDQEDLTLLIKAGVEQEVLEQSRLGIGPIDETAAQLAFIERLGTRVESLMQNIHDAKKGITRLEARVNGTPSLEEEGNEKKKLGMETETTQTLVKKESGEACAVCSQLAVKSSVQNANGYFPTATTSITFRVPLLFYPRLPTERFPRPTPLGWFTCVAWTWYLLEITMCELYSRPLHAEYYSWPDQQEPEWPFVLPTMLLRWTRLGALAGVLPGLLGLGYRLLVAFYRIVGMAFGWIDGFVEDGAGNSVASDVAASIKEAARETVKAFAEDFSMMKDEVI